MERMEAISRKLFLDFSWCSRKQDTETCVSEIILARAVVSRKAVVSHLNLTLLHAFISFMWTL